MPFDAIIITKYLFLMILVLKTIHYALAAWRLKQQLGGKHIKKFFSYFLEPERIQGLSWKIGVFCSLLLAYASLWGLASIYQLKSPLLFSSLSPWAWLWLLACSLFALRAVLQIAADQRELNEGIQAVKRSVKLKFYLRKIGQVSTVLGFAYPVLHWQSWGLAATWVGRFITTAKLAGMFEHWLDHRVKNEIASLVSTSIIAVIIETSIKLVLVLLAVAQGL
jgi:hypothetical protein